MNALPLNLLDAQQAYIAIAGEIKIHRGIHHAGEKRAIAYQQKLAELLASKEAAKAAIIAARASIKVHARSNG